MRARVYWFGGALVYFIVTYFWLRHFLPAFGDGGGVLGTVGAFWFEPPAVSWREYEEDWGVWFQYSFPYALWALVYTLSAAAANAFLRKTWPDRRPPILALFGASALFLLAGPVIQDAGTVLDLWRTGYLVALPPFAPFLVLWFLPFVALTAAWSSIRWEQRTRRAR